MSATHNITRTISSYCIYGNSLPTIIALIFHAVLLHNVSFGLSRQRTDTFSQYRHVSFSLRLLYFCQIKTYLQAIMLCCARMPARCRLRIVFTIEADIFSGILQVTELGQDSNLFFYFLLWGQDYFCGSGIGQDGKSSLVSPSGLRLPKIRTSEPGYLQIWSDRFPHIQATPCIKQVFFLIWITCPDIEIAF